MNTGDKAHARLLVIPFRLVAGFFLASIFILVPALALNTGSREWHIAVLAALGVLLVVPLFVACRPGAFNIFEPIWLYVTIYGVEFWLKPMLVLNYPGTFAVGFFSYQEGPMLEALALGCAGLAAFYGGYYSGAGKALATQIPVLKWPWPAARRRAMWLIFALLYGVLIFYFLRKGGFSLEYMYGHRQELIRGAGEFAFFIHVVSWLVAILAVARYVRGPRGKSRLVWVGFVCLIVTAGMSVFAARMSLLLVVFNLVIIWHFTVCPISFRSAAAILLALFLASALFGAFRSSQELQRIDRQHIVRNMADELVGYASWDALSSIVAFYPKYRGFYGGQLAGEGTYWLIPRRIWAGKPALYGSARIQEDVTPSALNELPEGGFKGSFIAQGTMGEGYADFGWPGALAYMFLIGVAWRLLFEFMQANRKNFPSVAIYAAIFSQMPVLVRGFSGSLVYAFLWFVSVYLIFKIIERPFLYPERFRRHMWVSIRQLDL